MEAKFDTEAIELSPRFIQALLELMMAECEMMQAREPKLAHHWTWGRCTVNDLASLNGLEFEYGGDEDMPDDGLGRFAAQAGASDGR